MDKSTPTTFGDLLRRHRLAAGLTQEELAARAQLSPRAISDLERGRRNRPWRDTVQFLAEALHLGAPELAELQAAARPKIILPQTFAFGNRQTEPSPRHNLPAALTRFVGREREIAELTERLRTTRLLTLTGIGGCGKSRLALRVGSDLVTAYQEGVWLVELAPIGDATFLAQTFARALGIEEESPVPILRTLLEVLRSRRLLLLVDNCEHLIAACADLIETILKTAPNVSVLATSREALGLAGEVAWRVPSLPLPPLRLDAGAQRLRDVENPVDASWMSEVARSAAVQLFVDRARTADPAFVMTLTNASVVAQICRRLDGIPLALELAAARLAVLSIEQIAARLDDRFRLLTGGNRTALPRQQTLRTALDWSYNLLVEAERRVLRRLSVFASGGTLEETEAVCDDPEVLDRLSQLVGKSLVLVDKDALVPRYRLLETVRQYAHERLVEAEEASETRGRHLAWFLRLAERAEPEILGAGQVEWLRRLEEENDDLRAALEWGLDAEPESAARLAGLLWRFWYFRSQLSEGVHWVDAALTVGPIPKTIRAKLLAANGHLLRDHERMVHSNACSEEALSLAREIGDDSTAGWALNNLGCIAGISGDFVRARALQVQGVERFRAAGDRAGVGMGLRDLAIYTMADQEDDQAQALLAESLAILRDVSDDWSRAWTLSWLADLALRRGQLAQACTMADEGEGLFRAIGTAVGIVYTRWIRGEVARLNGEYGPAEEILLDTLRFSRERAIGLRGQIDNCLRSLGKLSIHRGDVWRGVVLLGAGQYEVRRRASLEAETEATLALARSRLGEDQFAQAWANGEAMTRAQAITYALEGHDG